MLEKIDLTKRLSKKEFKSEIGELSERLSGLQQQIKALKIPVLIVFEGWSSAGTGTYIAKLLHPLDPRGYNVHTLSTVSEDAAVRPLLWRFWTKTPAKGRMAIFDRSWHRALLPESLDILPLSESEIGGFYHDVNSFERQLSDDGTLIIKLFLHISKSEQKKRLDDLLKNPETGWRVDDGDLRQNKDYDKYLKYFESIIQQSNFGFSAWNIIEANDVNYATIKMYKVIISKIEETSRAKTAVMETESASLSAEQPVIELPRISILNSVDLDVALSKKEYKKELAYYQEKISQLGFKLYRKRRPVVIVYEGWDAAGKGGNIRRLTEELDPRGYEVVPISAPNQEELSQHYLWRFWKGMPKGGHFSIFDRSWYGRVMVERLEGFCTDEEWQRAYREINDMELHLHNHGVIIFKFWLHIDPDEQLKRFNDRQSDPLKQHKITDEDWRNRAKWSEYEIAVNEMLLQTGTSYAPWTVVESNDKRYARIKTLKLVVETLEREL